MGEQHKKAKERAARLAQEGDAAGAYAAYRAIAEDDPLELGCLARTAELAHGLGKSSDAIEAYSRLAERYAADGLLLKAIAMSKQILAIDAHHTATQQRLATLYARRPIRTGSGAARRTSREPPPLRVARRRSMTPEPGKGFRDLIRPPLARTRADRAPPADALPSIPLFSDLPRNAFVEILTEMRMRELVAGDRIIEEGESGSSFFILSSGRVRVEKALTGGGSMTLAYLGEGAFFGEMALLGDQPRMASVIVEEPSQIFELDRAMLERTASRYPTVAKVLREFYKQRLLLTTLATHPLFGCFTPGERRQLTQQFRSRTFHAGEVLIEQGGTGQGLYVLLSGKLEVEVRGREDARPRHLAELGPGAVLGEMSLLKDQLTVATVKAIEDALVLRLGQQSFREVVSARPELRNALAQLSEERGDLNRTALSSTPTGDVMI